jgi:Fe-S-cluster containining protein
MPRVTTIAPQLQAVFEDERSRMRVAVGAGAPREAPAIAKHTVRMYGRLAQLQEDTIAAQRVAVACTAGCHYCCHLRVEVRPYEAFFLAAHVRSSTGEAAQQALLAKLDANLARIAPLTPQQHIRAGIPCALLDDQGRCGVYAARPAACRKYYSTAVDTCRDAHANPHAPLVREIEHEGVRLAGNAVALGFAKGIEDAGMDAKPVELHFALRAALTNPKAEKRWRDGKKPFV